MNCSIDQNRLESNNNKREPASMVRNVEELFTCTSPAYAGYSSQHAAADHHHQQSKSIRPRLSSREGSGFVRAVSDQSNDIMENNDIDDNDEPVNSNNQLSPDYGGPNRQTSLLSVDTENDLTNEVSTVGGEGAASIAFNKRSAAARRRRRHHHDATEEPSQEGEEAGLATTVDPTEAEDELDSYGMEEHATTDEEISNRRYSISELVACLGSGEDVSSLPPELERRVLDFRLAQAKRLQKHGETHRWGIFGMYAHLANVRTDLEWAEDAAWRRANEEPYLSWSDFDEIRTKSIRRHPWFTYFLIFVCSIMLMVEFGVNGWRMEPLKVNPLIGPSAETLIACGARETSLIVQEGQWFRLFSPLILHAGLIHYVINMGALYFIGGAVEQSHGVVSALLLFLIPGVGGNILSAVFLPQYISVGASGGIFGLIGGCLADITVNWSLLFIKDSENDKWTWKRNCWAIFWLFLEIVVNIVLGLTPYIDNFTHLGGLLYGLCCGWSTIEFAASGFFGYKKSLCSKIHSFLIRFFGFIVSVVFIMITTAWLATSDVGEVPCPDCRYLSCVPFPWWTDEKWWYCDDCDFVQANLYRTQGEPYYARIELTCPNSTIESIDVLQDEISTHEEMRDALPGYCRTYCDEVFARN